MKPTEIEKQQVGICSVATHFHFAVDILQSYIRRTPSSPQQNHGLNQTQAQGSYLLNLTPVEYSAWSEAGVPGAPHARPAMPETRRCSPDLY